jgi:hypothetical protein
MSTRLGKTGSPENYVPFKQLVVQKFDGQDWVKVTAISVE